MGTYTCIFSVNLDNHSKFRLSALPVAGSESTFTSRIRGPNFMRIRIRNWLQPKTRCGGLPIGLLHLLILSLKERYGQEGDRHQEHCKQSNRPEIHRAFKDGKLTVLYWYNCTYVHKSNNYKFTKIKYHKHRFVLALTVKIKETLSRIDVEYKCYK